MPERARKPSSRVEQLARAVGMLGERREGRAELSHRRGRGEAVADDVADRQRDPAVWEREGVVPVTADLEHVAAGVVPGCE